MDKNQNDQHILLSPQYIQICSSSGSFKDTPVCIVQDEVTGMEESVKLPLLCIIAVSGYAMNRIVRFLCNKGMCYR